MADKNVQLLNAGGDNLYPKTNAKMVFLSDGTTTLEDVASSEIKKIIVNGDELEVKDHTVEITIPSGSEYSLTQAETEDGYSSTYQLTKDGSPVGDKINIPKDMVVQSGSVETCAEADNPVEGYKVGDKYIDLLLANTDNQHIYVLVNDLVDVYEAGDGIKVSGQTISVDVDFVATKEELETVSSDVTTLKSSVSSIETSISTLQSDVDTIKESLGDSITYQEIV